VANKKKNNAKSQSDFIKFMLLTGLGGLLILFIMFGIFYSMMGKEDGFKKEDKGISREDKDPQKGEETGEMEETIGVVTGVDSNKIEIINIDTEEQLILNIESGTEMKDLYGNAMTLKQFKKGDIIQTKYDKGSRVPKYFRISGEAWEKKGIRDVIIDLESETIQVGNEIYSYTHRLITMYKNDPISLEDISAIDRISLKGYKNKALFIDLETSHGYIAVNSSDEDGTVEIDNNIFISIKEAKKIEVLEGSHKVVIKRTGYEPVVKNIQVDAGQVREIDLKDMKKKIGRLQVIAKGTTDYKIFINDVEYPANEIILLEYGDYHMIVKKEGYKDWSRDFKVEKEDNRIEIKLEENEMAKMVKVVVDTNPPGAEVYIDDTFIGTSPVERQIPFGEHKISLVKEGYSPIHFPASLEEGKKEKQFLFTLQEDKKDTGSALENGNMGE